MNPIYRTLTGKMECTMEGGKLYVRKCNCDVTPAEKGPWELTEITQEQAFEQWSNGADYPEKFRGGCMFHCLTDERVSSWFDIGKSARLRTKIDKLEAEYTQALADERADRPRVVSESQLAETKGELK